MLYAIVESGGKQYKAVEGKYLEIDHLPADVGKKVSFAKVLLLSHDGTTEVGTPYVKSTSVDATVLSHFRGNKIVVFKYKPRVSIRYRKKTCRSKKLHAD